MDEEDARDLVRFWIGVLYGLAALVLVATVGTVVWLAVRG